MSKESEKCSISLSVSRKHVELTRKFLKTVQPKKTHKIEKNINFPRFFKIKIKMENFMKSHFTKDFTSF